MTVETLETRALKYEFEIEINASSEAVWTAITEEINDWWLPDYHMVGAGSVVRLDARAGGPLVEQLEGGGSLLWYQVQMSIPNTSLHMVGHLGSEWGGPATTMLSLTLSERAAGMTLLVRDALYGSVKESTAETLESGWRKLFSQGLKAWVERK
ncbi:MAG: hypothetical protein ACI9F9_001240 [Candidatus Paceibacteria bacterium]|jgi:uncharacterized protein YndB with AHSA1/START domain